MRLGFVIVAALLSACATAPTADGPAQAAAAGDMKPICKRMQVVGSNLPQSICHSAEEWAAIEKQDRANIEEFDRARSEASSLTR